MFIIYIFNKRNEKVFFYMRNLFQAKLQSNIKQVDHYLVIKNVTIADSGYYMCTATNRGGTDIKIVHINVNG